MWRWTCVDEAPARAATTYVEECEAAREEVATLADRCIEAVAGELRERWPRWDPAGKPVEAESPEVAAGWDPWTSR
jgi:hypothetical protein